MDINRAIRELVEEKKRIDKMIALLEARQNESSGRKPRTDIRRGRKFMSENERRQVSERMTKYWAAKRAAAAGDTSQTRAAGASDDSPATS